MWVLGILFIHYLHDKELVLSALDVAQTPTVFAWQ